MKQTRAARRAVAMSDRSYIVVSDVHAPYHDVGCLEAIKDVARDLQPHGWVVNGDFLDLIEVSRHSAASVAELEGLRISRSFESGNDVLDEYEEAWGPRCTERHFLDGNHEARLDKWCRRGDNAVWLGDEGTSIAHRLRFKQRGFVYHKDWPDAHIRLGKLAVTHGFLTSKYHANAHLERYRHAVLYGHTHNPQVIFASTLDGQTGAFGTGHLADPSSPALKYAGKPNRWIQGFSVVHVRPSGAFSVQLLNFWRGVVQFGTKRYGKEK